MSFYVSSLLFTSLASLALGIFVYLKGKEKRLNITLGLFSFALSLWCFGQLMGEVAPSKELVLFWTRFGLAGAVFLPVFFLHFILVLIKRDDKEKKAVCLAYAAGLIFLLLDFTALFVPEVGSMAGFRYYPKPGIVYPLFTLFILACFLYGFFRLFLAYKNTVGAQKNQFLYVIFACVVGFAGGVTTLFPVWGINFPVLSHFALPLYVLITVYAILKHRLLDISVILREGLIYSTLTLLFTGFYVLAVLFTNYFLSHWVALNSFYAMLAAVFIAVVVFQPLKDQIQRLVDRLFFKGEFRYQKTISDLSSENRKLYRSLLQADKLAALGAVSAGMAHEIKNPLASIKGLTQVLEENLSDPKFIRDYQEIVDRQINRINELVEKLLKFGQPPQLTITSLDLNQVIEEVLGLVATPCRKGNIKINTKLGPSVILEADREQIAQVLLNLVLNAVQAMQPEGGTLTLSAQTKSPGGVIVEVADTGRGIQASDLDNIFDPFFTTKEEGSGMGLAVVYRIVKGHGGEINVESLIGKGTKFTLWLPIRPKP